MLKVSPVYQFVCVQDSVFGVCLIASSQLFCDKIGDCVLKCGFVMLRYKVLSNSPLTGRQPVPCCTDIGHDS